MRYLTSTMCLISATSLDAFFLLTYMPDLLASLDIMPSTFVARMSTARPQRPRPAKPAKLARRFATFTMRSTQRFTNGSTVISTILAELRRKSRQRLRKTYSTTCLSRETLMKTSFNSNIATHATRHWRIVWSRVAVHLRVAATVMPRATNVTAAASL